MNMVSIGVLLDCISVLIGILIGCIMKKRISDYLKQSMNIIFGIAAMAIGMYSINRLVYLPALVLSLVFGGLIGECLHIERNLKGSIYSILQKLNFKIQEDKEAYLHFYVLVTVTFCASGTNIFGAINEGISGDYSILLSKAVMDIFAAAIFAATLGKAMSLIVLPQFIFLNLCFLFAKICIPFINQTMLSDFVAMGGLLTFVLGLSIAKIKDISVANLLPSLVLIMPCSYLFSLFV